MYDYADSDDIYICFVDVIHTVMVSDFVYQNLLKKENLLIV